MAMKFTPCANYQLAMTGASVPLAFNAQATNADDMYVYNGSAVVIALRWGASVQTALTTDFTIAPGASFIVTKGNGCGFFAAIGANGTLYVSPGESL